MIKGSLAALMLFFPAAAPHIQVKSPHVYFVQATSKEFVALCLDETTLFYCYGYISGLSDGVALKQVKGTPFDWQPICIPQSVNVKQKTAVVVRYVESQPARWHELASILVLSAWREAWPCAE